MKERPILFSGDMVRAILDGRKTQTRRPVKPQPFMFDACPLGQPGDRLWVRETWAPHADMPRCAIYRCDRGGDYQDTVTDDFRWRPSIHMPRWASRITLKIVRVSVERVRDITEEGAIKEGCVPLDSSRPREMFGDLWQSIYGTWDANPWVWAVEFRRVKP